MTSRTRSRHAVPAERRLGQLGITGAQIRDESPSLEEVPALCPAGEYRFPGRTVEVETLASAGALDRPER